MRSLHGVMGLLFVVVPGLAASCSGDSTTNATGGGGAGGDAGESAQAGSKNTTGGKDTNGGTSASNGGAGGEAGEATGGTTSATGGQAGAGAAAPEGGAGAGNAGAGNGGEAPAAGSAGEGNSGAGGEAGAPNPPGPVIVFDAGPHNGLNFGGRVGLDQHCATAKATQSIPGAVTHALISVSATADMRDMPALYGVPTDRAFVSPTGKQLADNWADLLDGSIDQSLTEAGVCSAQFWISGSNTDGSVRSTCNGWTTSEFSQQVTGTYGYPASKDSLWITITDGDVYCSASQYNVICLAY
jgi:hypothetical protein